MDNYSHNVSARKLRVFLCHASEDKPVVRDIYHRLKSYNIDPWLDEKNLLPGEKWELLIPDVIRSCDIILICLSRTFLVKEGFGHSEIDVVLETAKRKPPNTIYHIPFRLDDSEVPSYLGGVHYASHFIPEDFDKLIAACEKRRQLLNTIHGMNIEPLYQQDSSYFSHPSITSDNTSAQIPLSPVPPDKKAPQTGVPGGGAATNVTFDGDIKIEHFKVTASTNPINVFLSYVPEDEWLLDQLEVHLSMLKREGLISTWCVRQIMPGANWAGVIDQHMEQASLILLLVSADFLASHYCYQVEVKRALERHQADKAVVIPIVMRPTDWQKAPFAHLWALPTGAKAITQWSNMDNAFVDVVAGIRKVVEQLASRPPISANGTEKKREVPLESRPENTTHAKQSPGISFGAPFPETWNVVRRHNHFFTGRSHVLEALFAGFGSENDVGMVPPQALSALGGMGKTQTAAEYAYHFREHYQAVLWVRAETRENLLTDFQTIARLLKISYEQGEMMQAMREWFQTQTGWLLILDNADDLALVDPFLPRAARGHVLLTTRAGATVQQAQTLSLDPLGPDDGALCILRRAGIVAWNKHLVDAPEASVDAARQLAVLMEGLPLALEQAGAYINDTASGVRRYLQLYQRYRAEIRVLHPGTVHDYPESVASAWKISRNIVEQTNPAATELLRLCAYLAPEAIPDEVLTAGAPVLGPILEPVATNPVTLDLTIGLLRKYSLLNREADRQADLTRLSIHRIMQEILLDEMDEPTQQLWAERAVRVVAQSLPTMPWRLLQAHAQNCLRLIEQWKMTFPEANLFPQLVEDASNRGSHQEET